MKKLFKIAIIWCALAALLCSCTNDPGSNNNGNNNGEDSISVAFNNVTANGSISQTTTQLALTFSQAITGLNSNDISLNGISGVAKGTLSGSGPAYTLGISGFGAGGTLTVGVAKTGYTVSGSPRTVTIYYYSGGGNSNDAEANKKRLFNYLADEYGKYIISGQMDTAWTTNATMDMIARVYADTGKYPALKGFDFIDLPNSWSGYGKDQIDEAIEWWEGKNNNVKLLPGKPDIHGIVAFCWHWRVGSEKEFDADKTSFRIPWKDGKLDTQSTAFQTIKSDLDKVAALFQLLKDRGIPVLWRPLHEAAGNYELGWGAWFWWGASGPEPYKALWEFMYDYFTNTKGLNNLIWVWNGQHKNWFPNLATVDIVGYDIYHNDSPKDYSSQKNKYDETRLIPPGANRIVALTENGAIPDPDECIKDKAMWSWFMTWNDSRNTNGETHKDNFWTGEYHNTNAHKTKVYNHPAVVTLDKLPDLTKYRLEGGHDIDTPHNNMPVITLTKNGEWGWQYLYRSDSLFNGAKITKGDIYIFTYSFTSNVNMDKLSVFFADNVGGWKQISNYVDVKTNITAGIVTSGTATITANETATNATAEANIMGFDAGTGTTSSPTLTFTTFKLQKNN
jgi:mannan endo-1,4-beta-mannosidase